MTRFRTDVANDDINWRSLFDVVAGADNFSAMRDPIYASGCLRTGYLDRVATDVNVEEQARVADLDRLRDLLTWVVRGDRFDPGVGDDAYRSGCLDVLFGEMSDRAGVPYSSARRNQSTPAGSGVHDPHA
ncbi:MAG: hypothetical protein BMS9Abin17_1648 [Acidimicrobiia bacterium]|nr:MAG: hypothetical protein BMS9Abin17_1648 [Acidimicrobiia bacterium]